MAESKTSTADILVPELGESILDATVVRWLKKVGDPVTAGDALVELETAKVNLEVSADRAGTLASIARQENEDVHVGDVLGTISASPDGEQKAAPPDKSDVQAPVAEKETGQPPAGSATPVARRIALDQGIDLNQLHGTGPGGKVAKADVVNYLSQQSGEKEAGAVKSIPPGVEAKPLTPPTPPPARAAPPIQPPSSGRTEERVKMSRRRRTIAENLVHAHQVAAMLTTFNEVDMTAVMALRARNNEGFLNRHGVKLGIASFFIKASIGALKAFPLVNAEIQGDEIVIKHYYDIGVAVAAPGGLVVPVIHDADRLTFAEIETRIKDFSQKTQNNTLTLDDLRGGTFTITNGGVFGSLMSTPILTLPQVAILGLHKIQKRPVVVNDEMVIRQMMYLALTYDHRIVDGQQAVQFLVSIKDLVENPENMLLEA